MSLEFIEGVMVGLVLGFTIHYVVIPVMVDVWFLLVRRARRRTTRDR